ncbi:glycosyltransferase family 4 protein [Devriesea agamarum]|uniref:glycosyltransferase family 4 protein n=1 Tax=Devriesea agamarum TaxID=472569 RepID=UPI00071DCE51|nr:glycosyltransferase family 4 protein [Devriesea agamarum]
MSAIAIAANNGDIGGGEVMQLQIAEALRALGHQVLVVGPSTPGDLVAAAAERGFDTRVIACRDRRTYMAGLAWWRMRNPGIGLWCNGLVPAMATAGMGPRIVHLHRIPDRVQKPAVVLAQRGAARVLVPSRAMSDVIFGASVFENWTRDIPFAPGECAPIQPSSGEASSRGSTPGELLPGKPFSRQLSGRGAATRPLTIGFLGRLSRDKGVDVFARAMRQFHAEYPEQCRVLIAGESRFTDAEDRQVVAHALADIDGIAERVGWIRPEDFFRQVDIAVFPSVWTGESFGLVLAEAMAAGVPFLISEIPPFREVAGAHHRWSAPKGDAETIARTVRQMACADHLTDIRRARARWEKKYSPQAGLERVDRLLHALRQERTA